METNAERRRRKLAWLCDVHGLENVADLADLNPDSLSQIIKRVKLPKKKDGTRSERGLGDPAARKIEGVYELGEGWFDSPDDQTDADHKYSLSPEAMRIAASFDDAFTTKADRIVGAQAVTETIRNVGQKLREKSSAGPVRSQSAGIRLG